MILRVYAIRDKAVNAFLPPFFCRTDGEAARSFRDAVSDPKHMFYSHAEDYELYWLDDWDDAIGEFSGRHPERMVSGLALSELSQRVSQVSSTPSV
ncbi:nonstructural protein [robinz microvirus RP_110]|nr:nonstructural protein [robinz microvirus RP_110]